MPLQFVGGDLFANQYNAQALAHGCNCVGAMGAGIAVSFRLRYPEMYTEYRRLCLCQPRGFNPGDVFLWRENDKPAVFNLATQEDTRFWRATEGNVRTCLTAMLRRAEREGIQSIALPRIGAGKGGLSWADVRAIILRLPKWDGTLYVYEQYFAKEIR